MLVSIGLPFFNADQTLAAALQSIFAQSLADWELILLDDGSSDKSMRVAASIQDRRVRLFSDGRNRGLSYRLNQSAMLACGKYLARMDADDVMHPDRLRRQLGFLQKHPDIDVVGTGAYIIDPAGKLIGKRGHMPADFRPAAVLERGLFIHPTVMGRTEWFRANLYDVDCRRAEDHDQWCRTLPFSRFAHLPDLLMFYREGGAGALRKYVGSGKTDRRIFRRYSRGTVGRMRAWQMMAASSAKVEAFRILHAFGLQHLAVALRNGALNAEEVRRGEEILHLIDHVAMPQGAVGEAGVVEVGRSNR